MDLGNFSQGRRCPDCHENSKGEIAIKKILDDKNIKYVQQYKIKECCDIKTLPFDFYLNDYNTLIEYDGIQHFDIKHAFKEDKFYETVIHDAIKKQFAKDNNIRLVEVDYKNVLYSDVEKCLKDNFIY